MAKRLALFLMIGVLVLGALAACGGGAAPGGEEGGGGGEGAVEETAEETTGGGGGGGEALAVSATEMKFTPNTLECPANSTCDIEVTNDGTAAHDLTIDADGSGEKVQVQVPPGETQTATVKTGSEPLTFYCSVPGHRGAGMEGTINVK